MIGKYERLSISDGDLDGRDENNSIEHQRSLIDEFLASKAEFRGIEAEEYVDDGYSGKNFDRPGFRKMMESVKSGRIDTIIVKDFTRFGRENTEVGKYLEQIFPVLGIRFIAINNNYDSSAYYSESAQGMDETVSSLVSTFHRRDVGKRLHTANEEKWKQGYSTSGSAPFGYLQDPERKGRYVLDPPAAEIVRKIFDLALEGCTTSQIAHRLNEEKVPIASEYNRIYGIQGKERQYSLTPDKIWNAGKVWKILTTYEYTGAIVLGKSRVIVPGRTVIRKNAPRDQYVTENAHEAIVTHEEFERAQGVIQYRTKGEYLGKKDFPLRSKIRCGHCHRVMAHDLGAAEPVVWCRDGREMPQYSNCPSGQYSIRLIEKQVFQALREWLELLVCLKEMVGAEPSGGSEQLKDSLSPELMQLLTLAPDLLREKALTKEAVKLTIDRVYVHGENMKRLKGNVEVRFRFEKEIATRFQ